MGKKIDIGLDIGIASVGWAVVDSDNGEIIKHGSRLFRTVDSPKDSSLLNAKRREQRSARRQKERRKTLRRDFVKFLLKNKIITLDDSDYTEKSYNLFIEKYITSNNEDIFEIRKEALTNKISDNNLVKIMFWYLNHRGYKYSIAEEKVVESKTIKGFPVDAQLEYIKKNGYLNGDFNRNIKHSDYLNEIKQIFKINPISFGESFIEYFNRQRSFELGPGSEKSISPFGRFYYDEDNNLMEHSTIWEKTVGKCSLFPEETRAPKNSAISSIFNLINDLVNIRINSKKISSNDIFNIIKIAFQYKGSSGKIVTYLMKAYNLDSENDIKGLRVNKSGKQLITEQSFIVTISKALELDAFKEIFKNDNLEINPNNIFDQISIILNKTTIIENRIKDISKILDKNFNVDEFVKKSLTYANVGTSSQTHSFSFKAMRIMIPVLFEDVINQSSYIHSNFQGQNIGFKGSQHQIITNFINDLILTPTVKRSLRETFKVLQSIFSLVKEKDLVIKDIVVEMARETKNKDTKDSEKHSQKYFEDMNKDISEYLKEHSGKYNGKTSSRIREKVWLWKQQKELDAYTGEHIPFNKLISDSSLYDIDHIIPYSQTFDNSRENKVLTNGSVNRIKSNRTPKQYLSNQEFARMSALWRKWYIEAPSDQKAFLSHDKYRFLTTELDMSLPENQVGFIQRNLVDTRYATKMTLKLLDIIKNKNKLEYKVKTINGKMTSFARRTIGNNLNRPDDAPDVFDDKGKKSRIWHGHHAEDAYLITVINNNYRDNKIVEKILNDDSFRFKKLESSTGEVINTKHKFIESNFDQMVSNIKKSGLILNDNMENVNFSRRIEKRENIQLHNETLYGGKYIDNKLHMVKTYLLTKLEKKKAQELFDDEYDKFKGHNLLIFKNNKPLFEKLKQIYNNYSDESLPFDTAYKEAAEKTGLVIFGKDKNGKAFPLVKKVRYIEENSKQEMEVLKIGSNGESFYTTLNWLKIYVYKNKDNKFELIPINATNARVVTKYDEKSFKSTKIIKIIDEQLNKWKESKNIDINAIPVAVLEYGDIISDGKVEYFVKGLEHKSRKLDLEYIHKNQNKQSHFTINTSLKGFHLMDKNILGHIKRKRKLF